MTDETPDNKPKNPWEDTRASGKKKSDLDALIDMAKQYQKNSGGNGGGNTGGYNSMNAAPPRAPSRFSWRLLFAAAVVVWLASGVYQVAPDQQGVVMRFGKNVGTTSPGLNYHLPYPFESVIIANVTRENRILVGFDAADGNKDIPAESQMLTGDDNIVNVHFVVTWQVQDIGKFLFRVRDPEDLAKMAAESVMREIVGQTKIQDILTTGRQAIEARAADDLQKLMDEYDTGIHINRVSLRDAAPPAEVLDAFHEVQRAQADAEQSKNKALAYQNDILPRARGEATRMTQEAEAYQQSVVAKADGEAQHFNSIYDAYIGAKEVTQKRMYLEAMEDIYSHAKHIVIDKNAGANTIVPLQIPGAPAAAPLIPQLTPAPAVTPMPRELPTMGGAQ